MKKWICFLAGCMFFTACRDDKKEVKADAAGIYFDYQVSAEEGNDKLAIKAEFREKNRQGDAVSIRRIGTISLDGQLLPEDSTKRTGYFYESYQPISEFEGDHELRFSRPGAGSMVEKFHFTPLSLQGVLPDTIHRDKDLVLTFTGVSEGDQLHVLLTDTSSGGNGVSTTDLSGKGQVIIKKHLLDMLYAGPVLLEVFRETDKEVENGTPAGGRLLINYTLRRQLVVAD